jgi:chloramphenicol-sensitive protein RarD
MTRSPQRYSTADSQAAKGVAYALAAYLTWGSFPLFFALFEGVPAWEILIHRVLWSCVFLAGVVSILGRWAAIKLALRAPERLGRVLGCAVLIAVNWGIFIYAVETRQVLQASLGYFLTPLVNVALGYLVLRERMAWPQVLAVLLAAIAIAVQLVSLGEPPWISLLLAVTFGTYGLLRKQVLLDGLSGLFLETLLLFPIALAAIFWLIATGASHFLGTRDITLLLIASGVATALPLMAFAGAARRLRLATLGFLMYLNPSIQFAVALLVLHEPLSPVQLASFAIIWVGLALYSWSAWQSRPKPPGVRHAPAGGRGTI